MIGNPSMDSNCNEFLAEEEKAVRHQINSDILNVFKKVEIINSCIEDLDRAIIAHRRLPCYATGTPLDRAIELKLQMVLVLQIISTHTVRRRYFTVIGEYPEEEVIEKIISDNGGEHFIKDRHEVVKVIEKSLLEPHQVFLDDMKDGSKELHQAKGYQGSSRKFICIGLALLLNLILVTVIPIATSFKSF
ncbi:hypothetical protein MKX03_017497 [Papaver bracteatum]|nr:hypothetical protein MKX03_017497 [Papaver bracteatum]